MNDPKTAAQHNAPQTGEAYSILNNAEIASIRRYGSVSLLVAEYDVLVKERDTLREQVTKLREACLSLLGAAENETTALPSTIVMARKALAETEAR